MVMIGKKKKFSFTINKLKSSIAVKKNALKDGLPDRLRDKTQAEVDEVEEAIEILENQ